MRIHQLPAPAGKPWEENSKAIAASFFKDLLQVEVPVLEIDCAHRVGVKRDGTQSMLVKFFRRDIVENILSKKKLLKEKKTKFVIHEDSTLPNRKLINRLHNHDEIERAWLSRGTVWAVTKSEKKLKFDLYDDIAKRISDLP